jgi:hypothetical protein
MWEDVEKAVMSALLISWDSCHKIYIAMDGEQAAWFERNYTEENNSVSFRGAPWEMYEKIQEWWDVSCGLRFISAVWTDNEDPNNGFISLIPQFAEV